MIFVFINLVIIFWNFTVFQYRFDLPQVKRNLISIITNLRLPHKLPNDLRLNILGNQKYQKKIEIENIRIRKFQAILEKSQIAVKKTRKSRYQTFLFRYSFTGPLPSCSKYPVQDCLSSQIFGDNLTHQIFFIFSITSKHFSNP